MDQFQSFKPEPHILCRTAIHDALNGRPTGHYYTLCRAVIQNALNYRPAYHFQ
jgi:hypothetical protein